MSIQAGKLTSFFISRFDQQENLILNTLIPSISINFTIKVKSINPFLSNHYTLPTEMSGNDGLFLISFSYLFMEIATVKDKASPRRRRQCTHKHTFLKSTLNLERDIGPW